MKYLSLSPCRPLAGAVTIGLALLAGSALAGPPGSAPTVRVFVRPSTNQFVEVNWAPPQATLQSTPSILGGFGDVAGATTPHLVDTRLAPGAGYRACLALPAAPTTYIWRDNMAHPGAVVLDWYPRTAMLQESANLVQWQATPAPGSDWYFPATPPEPPAGVGLVAGLRVYRTIQTLARDFGPAGVFSMNIPGYANYGMRVGVSNYLSFIFQGLDQKLDTLLPMPLEAEGSTLQFYDSGTQQFGPTNTFRGAAGWRNEAGESPVVSQPACLVIPRSSAPGTTTVTSTEVGDVPQGFIQRVLPIGYSLNGPLIPLRGGITSVHGLFPNEGDLVFLYSGALQDFEVYLFLLDTWFYEEDFTPEEPVVGAGDAFFYLNTSGAPLVWTKVFSVFP